MKKIKNVAAKFTKQANDIIAITKDDRVVEILNLMIAEFQELEDVKKNEFVHTVNADIQSALTSLYDEIKDGYDINVVSSCLREIKNSLVKRYNLVADIQ